MARTARIRFVPLQNTLANLPLSIYSPLVQAQKRPQALALHVTSADGREAYLGWSGLSASRSPPGGSALVDETLEVDPGVGEAFGWSEGDVVELAVLHALPQAQTVSVAPLAPEDWDVISQHADYLEQNLLFSVRVVSPGQLLTVWIQGKNRVRMRVESLVPSSAPALLLSQSTEVIVAPSLRKPSLTKQQQQKQMAKAATTPSPIPALSPPPVFRVLPERLLPGEGTEVASSGGAARALLCAASASLLATSTSTSTIRIQHLPRPGSNKPPPAAVGPPSGSSSSSSKLNGASSGSSPSSGVPGAATDDGAPAAPAAARVLALGLTIDERVPFGHVVLVPPTSKGKGQRLPPVREWELVRAWVGENGDEVAGEKKEGAAGEEEKQDGEMDDGPLAASVLPAPPSGDEPLPGVQIPLAKAEEFLIDSFVLQSGLFFSSGSNDDEGRRRGTAIGGGGGTARTLLLTGNAGTGKTTLARALAHKLSQDSRVFAYPLYLDVTRLANERIQVVRDALAVAVKRANWHRPTTLIIDGLDALCGPELEHSDPTRARTLAELVVSLLAPSSSASPTASFSPGVVVLATAKNQADVHPLLAIKSVFGGRVSLGGLGKDGRREVLASLVRRKLASSSADGAAASLTLEQAAREQLNYTALSTQTEGYSVADLGDLVGRAVREAAVRSMAKRAAGGGGGDADDGIALGAQDFETARKGFVPLSLRDVKLQVSSVQWSDIGGLQDTRQVLRETLEWPTKYGAIFAQSPLRLRSGLLLYGYPGCGKTLLASAVARECGLNFISVKGPEILNKYIGASEKSVRDLFERASAAKPCVLFFDEFDSIAPRRGHDSTGVTDRVVNQLLTQMDGAEGLEGVYVLAATSRPDLIDPALLRPGRLDKSLLCPLPSASDRLEILQSMTKTLALSPDVDLAELASDVRTAHFSGADLGGLVGTAQLAAVHASIDEVLPAEGKGAPAGASSTRDVEADVVRLSGRGKKGSVGVKTMTRAEEAALRKRVGVMLRDKRDLLAGSKSSTSTASTNGNERKPLPVTAAHFSSALESARPSVPASERARLGRIYAEFADERSPDGLEGEEGGGAAVGSRVSLG